MRAWRAAVVGVGAALAGGCGQEETPPVSVACTAEPRTIVGALEAAPRPVTLADGTPLSQCIRRTRTEGDLQNVGVAFSNAAEDLELEAPRDPEAALRLGYLVGAVRRGTVVGGGVQDELLRRIERSADLSDTTPAAARALEQGLQAGEQTG